jgi:DNA primase
MSESTAQRTPTSIHVSASQRNDLGPTLVDRIKQALPLAQFVSQHTELKPAGKGEMVGCCMLHEEKTASFHVNTEKNIYHCKGCGAAGNVIQLFAALNDLSATDAKIALGKQLGVYKERALDTGEALLSNATRLYMEQLGRKPNAMAYLESRGLQRATMEKFGVGFCWGREYMDLKPDQQALAQSAGLMREETKKSWLAGRITFPVRDKNGRVVGFGGRLVPSDDYVPHGPKYMNTPETAYFKKSELLYGLYEASMGIGRAGRAIVVEGYMDVLMQHQHGVDNVVAVMGAQASENAFKQLWQVTKNVVFCLDPDAAGEKGALRSVMAAAPTMTDGCTISIATMPAGVDPDDFTLEHGAEAFKALCDQGVPLAKYLMASRIDQFDLSAAEGRAGLIMAAREIGATFSSAPLVAEQLEEEARAVCAAALVESVLRKMELPKYLDQREVEMAAQMLTRLIPDVPRQSGRDRIAQIRKQALERRSASPR